MKYKLNIILILALTADTVYCGDAITQIPGPSENKGSASIGTDGTIGGYGTGIKANLGGEKKDGFEATAKTPVSSHSLEYEFGSGSTIKNSGKIGKYEIEKGCKNGGEECETKKTSFFGLKEETEKSAYSKTDGHGGSSPSTFKEFNQEASKEHINNPIIQPVEKSSKCVKYGVESMLGGSKETCYVDKATSAAEQSLCNNHPDDPSCGFQPTAIKSETFGASVSATPLPAKAKQIAKETGIDVEAKVDVREKFEYYPDKETYDNQTKEKLLSERQGKPGSCNINDGCVYRQNTIEVIGQAALKYEGQVDGTNVKINPLTIKATLPSTTYVDTPITDALRKSALNDAILENSEYSYRDEYDKKRKKKEIDHQDDVNNALLEEQNRQDAINEDQLSQQSNTDNSGSLLNGINAIVNGAIPGIALENAINNTKNPKPDVAKLVGAGGTDSAKNSSNTSCAPKKFNTPNGCHPGHDESAHPGGCYCG